MGTLQLPYFLSAFVALFLAPLLSRLMGKKLATIVTGSLALVLTPLPIILRLLDLFPANGTDALYYSLLIFYSIDVTLMITSAILGAAMLADVVEDSELKKLRQQLDEICGNLLT